MDIDEKIAEFKTNIESCERVCEAIPTGTIRDAAIKKAEDCKQMVEWLEDYKRLKTEKELKADTLDKIRKEMQNLRNCSCSCSDGIIDDVEDIIDKYQAESEVE